jgi:hypothetical protein
MKYLIFLLSVLTYSMVYAGNRQQQLHKLDRFIVEGKYEQGLLLADRLLKYEGWNKEERYRLQHNKTLIYFYTDNLDNFMESARSAYALKRTSSPVYLAYIYAQKSYFFHYHYVSDSAEIYADKSIFLLRKHKNDRLKIPFHFIYQMYGTTSLYRVHPFTASHPGKEGEYLRLKVILNYFDSAKCALHQYTHFPQDEAILCRSIANRNMDVVGYTIRKSINDFDNPKVQLRYIQAALEAYKRGLESLNKCERVICYGIKSLEALAFYCSAQSTRGDSLLWPIIRSVHPNRIHHLTAENIQLLHVFQVFTQAILSKKKYDPRIERVFTFYRHVRPWWYMYLLKENRHFKDSYGFSPTTMLSLISHWKEQIKHSNLQNRTDVYPLDGYIYYSQTIEKLQKATLNTSSLSSKLNALLEMQHLQKKLKPKEAVLLKIVSSMNMTDYLLLTNSNFYIEGFKSLPDYPYANLSIQDISHFKHAAFRNFRRSPFSKILKKVYIKKLYVPSDVDENYEFMVMDTMGKRFDELNYLKQHVNVVRMHNPIDFFANHLSKEPVISSKITPIYVSKSSKGKLPYSEDLFLGKTIGSLQTRKKLPNGILHLLGHGKLNLNRSSGDISIELQKNCGYEFSTSKALKPELIILNVCYGSLRRTTFLPDRDLQNNLISRGAKAVIASPYKTVDQSSAYIFEKFYAYLDQGITAEDALQKAKMDYLKTHKGSLAHPMYWSTYELTTNVKDLRMAPKPKPFPWEWIPIFTFLVGVGGAAWWSLRR